MMELGSDVWDSITDSFTIIIGLAVTVLPLFILPFLIRSFSGANIDKMAGKLQTMGRRAASPATKALRKRAGASASNAWKQAKLNPDQFGRVGGRVARYGARMDHGAKNRSLLGSQLDEQANTRHLEYLEKATDDELLALTGGNQAAADRLKLKAAEHGYDRDKRDLATAQTNIQRTLASKAPADRDNVLKEIARDQSSTPQMREAALHEAARLGRSNVIDELSNDPSIDTASVQRAIQANAGALVDKAPDQVKGEAGFSSVTGAGLAKFSKDTMERYIKHVESKAASGDSTAANELMAALADIQATPDLKAKFDSDVGKAIHTSVSSSSLDTAVKAYIGRTISGTTYRIN